MHSLRAASCTCSCSVSAGSTVQGNLGRAVPKRQDVALHCQVTGIPQLLPERCLQAP